MKHTFLSTAVAAVMVLGNSACDKKSEKGTAENHAAVQSVPKVSIQASKSSFDKQIKILSEYGFEINKTSPKNYLLHVTNEKQATASLLKLINLNTIEREDKEALYTLLKDAEIGVEIDWNKYASDTKESIFVYYLGNGKEGAAIKKLFHEKKIGAYLGYSHNQLKHIRVKNIDETLIDEELKSHILLKGMHAEITHSPNKTSKESDYDLFGGIFEYTMKDRESNNTLILSYKEPVCNIVKKATYLGTHQCVFPSIALKVKNPSDKEAENIQITLKKSSFLYKTVSHNKKIRSDIDFNIDSVDIYGQSQTDKSELTIKDIKITGNSDNIDEALIQSYMDLLDNPSKEQNGSIRKLMDLTGKMYSNGMTFDYRVSVGSGKGESKEAALTFENYKSEGKGSLKSTINYKDTSSLRHISLKDKKTGQSLFDLKNFRFGYGISELYNFIPTFMEFSGALAEQNQSQTEELSTELEKKLTEMGMKLVHHGFGFSFTPIGWDTFQAEAQGKAVQLGKVDLSIDTRLKKNNVPLNANNPMSAMMLLPYFEADGKLVLSKKDLEQLSTTMPPQMIGMLMMFAKYEGENAVFILKFENGHLMINGQPLM